MPVRESENPLNLALFGAMTTRRVLVRRRPRTNGVERVAGVRPQSIGAFVAANKDLYWAELYLAPVSSGGR